MTCVLLQDIALWGGARIRRSSVYPKNAAVAQEARCDGRDGPLRSQLSVSPQGHCYIRQGFPFTLLKGNVHSSGAKLASLHAR